MWEYKVDYRGELDTAVKLEAHLDGLGAEGWELCTVHNGMFIYKRPKRA